MQTPGQRPHRQYCARKRTHTAYSPDPRQDARAAMHIQTCHPPGWQRLARQCDSWEGDLSQPVEFTELRRERGLVQMAWPKSCTAAALSTELGAFHVG